MPKNTHPFQRDPVIVAATSDKLEYIRPSYSNPFAITRTEWRFSFQTFTNRVPGFKR
ncbi:hypothetical protein MICA_1986 [Micavibrio aeruginosavorus ARL-13]|uniref:Uncharacterized protein n=1 Tax=Micavibrio aeruginosavorus (strain ARL-13) TaxID=856793 RepID=G2KNP9_MICAA|nr:hypothetical protein MICA_1986 [Micavibrio aeruginosavorus ARL-13]